MLKNIKYLERFPYDDFFIEIFFQIVEEYNGLFKKFSAYYNLHDLGLINTNDDCVVIACTDTLYIQKVNRLADRFPDTKFLIISLNLSKELVERDNLQIINWGPSLRQQKDYEKIASPTKKLSQYWHWHFMSGYTRHHRMMLAIVLAGFDLEESGYIQCNSFPLHEYKNWQKFYKLQQKLAFPFDTYSEHADFLEHGFSKWKDRQIVLHAPLPHQTSYTGNNAENLDTYLRQYYEHSMIEIVAETEFYSVGNHTSEKFLHSVMGLTIPLLVGQRYHVRYLENLGFDMFGDILDLSYDEIEDPLLRMYTAVQDNYALLYDKELCLAYYENCSERLIRNRELAVYGLYDQVKKNTQEEVRRAGYWLSK